MDFAKFYNEQPDYFAFRNDERKREEYKVTVDWKARKLCSLVFDGLVFRNVLEIGCALGVLLNNLGGRLNIKTRAGIDISTENIKLAKDLFPGCTFIAGTIDDYRKVISGIDQDFRFDLVVLSDIIEHLPDDLDFLKKVSKISSHVLLNLPLEKCFINRNRNYGETDPSGHLRSYNKQMAVQLINQAGFEITNSYNTMSFSDDLFFKMYSKNRSLRVRSKPLFLRLFWTAYYYFEDKMRLSGTNVAEKIFGTNYFALLKSKGQIAEL